MNDIFKFSNLKLLLFSVTIASYLEKLISTSHDIRGANLKHEPSCGLSSSPGEGASSPFSKYYTFTRVASPRFFSMGTFIFLLAVAPLPFSS